MAQPTQAHTIRLARHLHDVVEGVRGPGLDFCTAVFARLVPFDTPSLGARMSVCLLDVLKRRPLIDSR